MTGVAWPAKLKPRDFGFYPIEADMSGGASLAGGEQIVASPGPRWGASGTFPIFDNEGVLAVRALRGLTKGRAIPVQLPNFDGQRLSWPIQTHLGNSTGVVLHPGVTRNKALDGTAYEDAAIPAASEIVATVNATQAIRSTTIVINKTQGGVILAGQQFGIGEYLYEIASITSVVGALTSVVFHPPLRLAATATTPIKFTRPICLMRCLNLGEEMKKLELLRFATLNLEFVEYI